MEDRSGRRTAGGNSERPGAAGVWALVLVGLFFVTRWFNLRQYQFSGEAANSKGDVSYYGYWARCLLGLAPDDQGCAQELQAGTVMQEYPVPATWIMQFLYTLGATPQHPWVVPVAVVLIAVGIVVGAGLAARGRGWSGLAIGVVVSVGALAWWYLDTRPNRGGGPGIQEAYFTWEPVYVGTMLALDLAVAILLFRRHNPWASLFWIVYIALCGALPYYRFDIITAALVTLSCAWLVRRPAVSGGLIGLSAAIKLWPAILAIPMAAWSPVRRTLGRRRTLGFLVVGISLAVASLVAAGWDRSASPLAYQRDRGLQIESVPATPVMLLHAFSTKREWRIDYAPSKAFEITGPGVELLLTVSSVLTVLALLVPLVLTWRMSRHFRSDSSALSQAVLLSVFATLMCTVVANKVLSTQYAQWLAGPLCGLLLVSRSPWLRRHVHALVAGMLLVAGLTQLIYPWLLNRLIGGGVNPEGYANAILVTRNLLIVVLTIHLLLLAWRATGPAAAIEDDPDRPAGQAPEELSDVRRTERG